MNVHSFSNDWHSITAKKTAFWWMQADSHRCLTLMKCQMQKRSEICISPYPEVSSTTKRSKNTKSSPPY